MNARNEQICRLCLKLALNGFRKIDETVKQLFNILLLKLDWDMSEDPIICQDCMEVAKKCLYFKSICIDTEKIILFCSLNREKPKHNIKIIYKEWVDVYIEEDLDICRLCLTREELKNFAVLMNDTMIKTTKYIPEMDLNTIENPVVCTTCRKSLQSYFQFVLNCLNIEHKIKAYCRKWRSDNTHKIVLHFLLENTRWVNPEVDSGLIKQEDVDMKDEQINLKESSSDIILDKYDAKIPHNRCESDMIPLKTGEHNNKTCQQNVELDIVEKDSVKDNLETKRDESSDTQTIRHILCTNEIAQNIYVVNNLITTNGASEICIYPKRVSDTKHKNNVQVNVNIRNTCDLVNFLVNQREFSTHCHEDKLYIVKELKRPVPDLSKSLVSNGGFGKPNRGFNNTWYEKFDWLTGSTELKKLFCWACILFAGNGIDKIWSKIGFNDVKNLSRSLLRHNRSIQHISSNCKLTLMRKQKQSVPTSVDNAQRMEIENFNSRVKENRQILRSLVDITLHLCMQKLPKRGNFKELVTFVSKYDTNLKIFLEKDTDTRSVFSGTSKTIQNELIDSVAFVLNKKIEDEISKSLCFSWQVDETTDFSCRSQLSVIFRYVIKGQPVERFMGFYDVSAGRSAEDLFQFLTTTFRQFDLHSKLVGQAYDRASVTPGELNTLQAKIKSIAPQAIFTPCYALVFNLDLSHACSSIQQVKVFFATLSGFSLYFSKSTERSQVLEEIVGNRIPTNGATGWNFSSRAVLTVCNNRDKLLEAFNFIINNRDFDEKSIRGAVGLKTFLEDPQNIFFLEAFTLIFQQTDTVFSILQDKYMDVVKEISLLQTTISNICEFRNYSNYYFEKIYEKLDTKRRKGVEMAVKTQLQLRHIFLKIIDIIVNQIQVRIGDIEKLHIFDLLNVSKFLIFANDFPQGLFKELMAQYHIFDVNQLKSELTVLYENDTIENCATPYEMFTFIHDNDLQHCMPELFKLLCIAVVLPVASSSTERSSSALRRIKTYIRNTTGQDRSSNMAKISIEREFIESQDINTFVEEVIDHFAEQKNRRIPLIYKKL